MENNIALSIMVGCNPPIHIFLKPTIGERCVCGLQSYENLFERNFDFENSGGEFTCAKI